MEPLRILWNLLYVYVCHIPTTLKCRLPLTCLLCIWYKYHIPVFFFWRLIFINSFSVVVYLFWDNSFLFELSLVLCHLFYKFIKVFLRTFYRMFYCKHKDFSWMILWMFSWMNRAKSFSQLISSRTIELLKLIISSSGIYIMSRLKCKLLIFLFTWFKTVWLRTLSHRSMIWPRFTKLF